MEAIQSTHTGPVLQVQNLTKDYGSLRALSGVSFDVPQGSVFGILGPNGSGKTTLLGTVLDVLQPTEGTYAWLGGMDPATARQGIGTLLETPNFYHYLNAEDNLAINAAIKQRGESDIPEVLRQVRLYERRHSKFSTFSLGMKQRLAIAAALLGRPAVLVLDEPTNGLDPEGITEIRSLIRQLNAQGTTIILASHLLDEVEKVCTHMVILKSGKVLVAGAVEEVLRSEDLILLRGDDADALEAVLKELVGVRRTDRQGNLVLVYAEEGLTARDVNAHCIRQGVVLSHLELRKKSLEAKFMELTQ